MGAQGPAGLKASALPDQIAKLALAMGPRIKIGGELGKTLPDPSERHATPSSSSFKSRSGL